MRRARSWALGSLEKQLLPGPPPHPTLGSSLLSPQALTLSGGALPSPSEDSDVTRRSGVTGSPAGPNAGTLPGWGLRQLEPRQGEGRGRTCRARERREGRGNGSPLPTWIAGCPPMRSLLAGFWTFDSLPSDTAPGFSVVALGDPRP